VLEHPRPSPELARLELLVDLAELAIVQLLAQQQPATQAMAAVAAVQQETLKELVVLAVLDLLLFDMQFPLSRHQTLTLPMTQASTPTTSLLQQP
jgi:hypothetical protein